MTHECGGCTLCCTLVPVDAVDLKKPGFVPCPHLRDLLLVAGPGCGIYDTRPRPCRAWSCVWLTSPGLPPELRPDRCGWVIDPVVDLIRVNEKDQPARQIWSTIEIEKALERDITIAAFHSMLDQVPFILWRQRGPDGDQWARAVARADDGIIGIGPLTKADATLGTELERWARVDQLMKRAKEVA